MLIMWGPEGPPPTCPECGSYMLAKERTECINCGGTKVTPTAEQIEREKGRAYDVAVAYYDGPTSSFAALVDIVATALAARAIDVREEALRDGTK